MPGPPAFVANPGGSASILGYISGVRRAPTSLYPQSVAFGVALALAGCAGTERTLFARVEDREVAAPPGAVDAGPDAAEPGPGAAVMEALDPNATFAWTETLPGAGTCPPGTYTGSFRCTIAGPLPIPLQGAITLALGATGEGQRLKIVEGSVVGIDTNGADLLSAELAGALDCSTEAFSATTVNGHALPDIPIPPLQAFDTFTAELEGTFHPGDLTITGTWTMTNQVGGTCEGTFRVSHSP
jgi:hypothetical protein